VGDSAKFSEARRYLAVNLVSLRERKGWSQQQAADAAGMDLKHWQKLEYGDLNPTLRTMASAALALDVPVARLVAATRATPERRPVGRPRRRTK
jgi:transcriptional regulator with XRE-family HTH domain